MLIRAPDGHQAELGHGDLVGRLATARLCLDDPRISEAHALVSHRGRQLQLLALRGRLAIKGKQVSEVVLEAGQSIHLAPDIEIEVLDVVLPTHVLGIEADPLPLQVLAGVCSLSTHPPRLQRRFRSDADAWFWGVAQGWTVELRDGHRQVLVPGESFVVMGVEYRVVRVPLEAAGGAATRRTQGLQRALRVVANYDTVEIHPHGGLPVVLNGVAARLVSELVVVGGPLHWSLLVAEVWGSADAQVLRHRLDVTLTRIRARLRKAGVRADLVLTDGAGCLQLLLNEQDVIEDRT